MPFQREVLHDAQVEVRECRLPHRVARRHDAIDNRAVVPVVRIMLRVETDDGRVGLAGMGNENRIELEAQRKIEDGARRLRTCRSSCEENARSSFGLKRVQRRVDAVWTVARVIIVRLRERVVDGQLRLRREICDVTAAGRRSRSAPRID